jgi:hypothetical protein
LAEHWFLSPRVRKWWECLVLINDWKHIPVPYTVAHLHSA